MSPLVGLRGMALMKCITAPPQVITRVRIKRNFIFLSPLSFCDYSITYEFNFVNTFLKVIYLTMPLPGQNEDAYLFSSLVRPTLLKIACTFLSLRTLSVSKYRFIAFREIPKYSAQAVIESKYISFPSFRKIT